MRASSSKRLRHMRQAPPCQTDLIARAADIPGLRPDAPFRVAAAATVAVRARELFAASDRVLDVEDIAGVHDMRVASRRLRAVLEIYAPCFPSARFDPVLREVKALADALGARRDPDVHLASLAEFAAGAAPGQQPGLAVLRARLIAQQAAGNECLAAALERMRERDLEGELAALVEAAA